MCVQIDFMPPDIEETICVLNQGILLQSLIFYFNEGSKQLCDVNYKERKVGRAGGLAISE